jgi:hypothetical protein
MAEVQTVREQSSQLPTEEEYDSDLYYLFMTVVDCERARKTIRQFVNNYRTPGQWTDQSYIKLHGMYDLLGKWDLAVRLRVGTAVKWRQFFDALEEELDRSNLLFKRKQDYSLDWFKVDRELSGFSESAVCILEQHRLSTSDYEKDRCQKGFLYVAVRAKWSMASSMKLE